MLNPAAVPRWGRGGGLGAGGGGRGGPPPPQIVARHSKLAGPINLAVHLTLWSIDSQNN